MTLLLLLLGYWHRPLSMLSRVYETVRCPSVCLSQHGTTAANLQSASAGLLLWARRTGDIDRLLHQRRPNAGSATLSAYVGS